MGQAAAIPRDWSVIKVYLAITVILSFLGWTSMARVVRGKFLSLREEEFVLLRHQCPEGYPQSMKHSPASAFAVG